MTRADTQTDATERIATAAFVGCNKCGNLTVEHVPHASAGIIFHPTIRPATLARSHGSSRHSHLYTATSDNELWTLRLRDTSPTSRTLCNCIQYSSPTVTVRIDAGYSYGCRIYGDHSILAVHTVTQTVGQGGSVSVPGARPRRSTNRYF